MIVIIGGAGNTQAYFSRFMHLLQIELSQTVRFLPLGESSMRTIERLFDEVPYDSTRILIGFSLGANAALIFTKHIAIDKLILISPVSVFEMLFSHNGMMETAKSYRPLRASWWRDMRVVKKLICFLDSFTLGRDILKRFYKKMNPNSPIIVLEEIFRRGYYDLLRNIETYVTGVDMNEALSNTKATRIRIICGKDDEFVHLSKTIQTVSTDPRLQVKICDGDHHMLLNNPVEALLRIRS
jgi:pimeloyl-ACP methyl ester carboxylesterase